MNETRKKLVVELHSEKSQSQMTRLLPLIKSSNPWLDSQKIIGLHPVDQCSNFPIFPFPHMVHLSYLFPLSFLINIFKCLCHENFHARAGSIPFPIGSYSC